MRRIVYISLSSCLLLLASLLPASLALAQVEVIREGISGKAIALKVKTLPRTLRSAAPKGQATPPAPPSASDPVLSADSFLREHGSVFGITGLRQELRPKQVETDDLGMSHVRYEQYYKNVPVFGAQLVAHTDRAGAVKSVTGKFVDKISLNPVPTLSRGAAEAKALKFWQKKFSPFVGHLQDSRLWVINPSALKDGANGDSFLVWQVRLKAEEAQVDESFFVNAHTGGLVYQLSETTPAIYREVYDYIPGEWILLLDVFKPAYNYTFGRSEGQPARGPNPITGLAGADMSYDRLKQLHTFFNEFYNRNGANGQGGTGDGSSVPRHVTKSSLDESLCPDGGVSGSGSLSMCSSVTWGDVWGHEYAHLANNDSRNLIYSGQSGTLEEAWAALNGEAFQRYLQGATDWLDSAEGVHGPYFNYADPTTMAAYYYESPDDTYYQWFYCGGSDHGGVHWNSTVPMYANYLMSKGGEFNDCSIKPIGLDRTLKIWQRAVLNYFVPSTSFSAAKVYLEQACSDLYSPAVCYQVDKAFRAVKMDQPGRCSGVPEQPAQCDLCPADPNKTDPGCNGCGNADVDTDSDGTPNCYDECPTDASKVTAERCGCGNPEVVVDADRDSFWGSGSCAPVRNDCDDSDNLINPDAAEVCDGKDNDCDGRTDEGTAADNDGDGHLGAGQCGATIDDCNDSDPTIYTGAPELCDGKDNDCDGQTDEDLIADVDGDGFSAIGSCSGTKNDCNDNDSTIKPGAAELCDGKDNDCDSQTDEGLNVDVDVDGYTAITSCGGSKNDCNDNDPAVKPGATELCDGKDNDCDAQTDEGLNVDLDGDGYTTLTSCGGSKNDCNDNDATIKPGATELCDGKDNDCDAQTDEGLNIDVDGDGYTAASSCGGSKNDCNDNDPAVKPGATELCDGKDNDCDAQTDEGLNVDLDGDGYTTLTSCGGSKNDCNDNDATIKPGATELCDGKDNDCDAQTDEGLNIDVDGDGYTSPTSCGGSKNDCNDSNAAIRPGATELCDGKDNDCDTQVDEGLTFDVDRDGYSAITSCGGSKNDCNDNNAAIRPGAAEICDSKDNDCDAQIDEGLTFDIDKDGYTSKTSCAGTKNDCNDNNNVIHPGAAEICGNGIDEDCSGADLSCACQDSDGGVVSAVFGKVTYRGSIIPDKCIGTQYLLEMSCAKPSSTLPAIPKASVVPCARACAGNACPSR